MGKIGVRSSGPAGCIVWGLSGGIGSPGRSGNKLIQWVGSSASDSVYFTVSVLMRKLLWRGRRDSTATDIAAKRGAHMKRRPLLALAALAVTATTAGLVLAGGGA